MDIKVTAVKMGSEAKELTLPSGSTLGDALEALGVSTASASEARVNGRSGFHADDQLREGDFVTFNPKVTGGNA